MIQNSGPDRQPQLRLLCGAAIAILLGFVALASYSVIDAWYATRDGAVQSSGNLTTALAHDIDRNITLYDLSLQTAIAGYKLPQLPEMSAAVRQAVLFDGAASAEGFGTTFVVDAAGNVQYASRNSNAEHLNYASRDFFVVHRDKPDVGLYISAPFRLQVNGVWAMAFSRRITNNDGSFGGVVFGSVRLDYFKRLFDRVDIGAEGTLTLIRTDGYVLMRKPFFNPAKPIIVPDFDHIRIAPSGSFEAVGQIDGLKRLFVYRQINRLPLVVTVGPTTNVIFAEWRRKAAVTIGLMAGLAATAVWLLFRLTSEFRRRAEAEARAVESESRQRMIADAERDARAALEYSIAQVESSIKEQRRIQTALRESEQRFRDFAESCGDWCWETDVDHRFTLCLGNIHIKNTALPSDPIGKTSWEMAGADPEIDPMWREHKQALDARQPFRRFRYPLYAADGQKLHLSTNGIPVFDENGNFAGYRGTFFDVTASLEARDRTRQAEARLRNAVDSISEGFIIYDANDRFVMCNAAHEQLYAVVKPLLRPGVPFEEILRAGVAHAASTRHFPDPEGWIAQRLLDHKNPAPRTVERQLWDGTWVLVCERKMSDGGTASLQIDISALKGTQRALHESEQRLARAQRIAGVGDIEHNMITGKVSWSDHAYHIYGVPKDRPLNWENFISLVHPDDRDHVSKILSDVRQGIPAPPVEYRIIRPDGILLHLLRENEPIYDTSGRIVRMASTVKDITELRQSQERERELHGALQHRQKLEALGTLAGGIAHDMNNTLVPILALSKRAMTHATPGTRERTNFETIYRASEHARDLVKQILTFSRKESVDKKPVCLGMLTRDALQMVHASLPASIALTEHIEPGTMVLGDAGQLRQVIINLTTNAAQAVGEQGGVIVVRVERHEPDRVRLSVSDTGCGVSDEDLPRLFDPFFTTKEAGQGTGLGLSVVHGIVTAHGGCIEVKSELGQGAEFAVTFPAVAPKNEAKSVESAA